MPPQVLQNIVTVTALAPGSQVSLPHSLVDADGDGLVPNIALPDRPSVLFVVSVDGTNVVFENPASSSDPETANFLVQYDHSIQRATPTGAPASLLYQGGGGGGGGTAPSQTQLWTIPSSPNAFDDEFNDGALDANWQLDDGTSVISFSGTGIDAYDTGFNSGTPRINYNSARPSWMMVQAPGDSTIFTMTKVVSPLPTNYIVYARTRLNTPDPVSPWNANPDGLLGLVVGASSGGRLDRSNYVRIYHNHLALVTGLRADKIVGGGTTQLGITTSNSTRAVSYGWMALHVRGANVWAWAGTESGSWVLMTTAGLAPFAPTIDRIGFIFQNRLLDPGPSIGGWDCIRVIENVSDFVL